MVYGPELDFSARVVGMTPENHEPKNHKPKNHEPRERGFEPVRPEYRQHPASRLILPARATQHSAGDDFTLPAAVTLPPGEVVKDATDVKAYMGAGEMLGLFVRSSLGLRGVELANTVGIIDAD